MDFPVTSGVNGLERMVVNSPEAVGEVYLQGAHVTSWAPSGLKPVLWMSRHSVFETGRPIRGGIPICFPWFGPHPSDTTKPAHGSARIVRWTPVVSQWQPSGNAQVVLQATIAPFELRLEVNMGKVLDVRLQTTLPSAASAAVTFEQALHTYFSVTDVRNITIRGLESREYIDKMLQARRCPASGQPIRFHQETDRVYVNTRDTVTIDDSGDGRQIIIEKSGSDSTVVWNPWIDKSRRMPDFGDGEWPQMVCVETANVAENRIRLVPGQSHLMTLRISVPQA